MKKRSDSYIEYLNEIFAEKYKENNKLPKNVNWFLSSKDEIRSSALSKSEANEVVDILFKKFPNADDKQISVIKSTFPDKFQIAITTSFIKENIAKKIPQLPIDMIRYILSFLRSEEKARVSGVSKLWKELAESSVKELTDTEMQQAKFYMNNKMKDSWEILKKFSEEIKDLRYSECQVIAINKIEGDQKNVNVIVENVYMSLSHQYDKYEIKIPIIVIKAFSELYTETPQSQFKK